MRTNADETERFLIGRPVPPRYGGAVTTETRDTLLLADALARAESLAAALATVRRERDIAVRTVTWDRAMLRRQRLLRFALCLSVATSGILLMRISTLPPPPPQPGLVPRAAAARPAPAVFPVPAGNDRIAAEPAPTAPVPLARPALPQVHRPD